MSIDQNRTFKEQNPELFERLCFGAYISGLTDGEGSFLIKADIASVAQRKFYCFFQIKLRADDYKILESIRDYWNCGRLLYQKCNSSKRPNTKPQWSLHVNRIHDLYNHVMPHFELFPLRAKKARDFELWKEAVRLAYKVSQRGRPINYGKNGPLWHPHEANAFRVLADEIIRVRQYNSENIPRAEAQCDPQLTLVFSEAP